VQSNLLWLPSKPHLELVSTEYDLQTLPELEGPSDAYFLFVSLAFQVIFFFVQADESIISVFNITSESVLFRFDFVLFNIISFLELFYFNCKLLYFRNK